jgi:hypothetical protein
MKHRAQPQARKWPTARQRRAYAKLLDHGNEALTAQEIKALAGHPWLTRRERAHYAVVAEVAR